MVCYNHICVYARTAAALAEVPTQTTERETKPALMNIGSFCFDTYSSLLQESNSLSSLKQVHAHMLGTGSVHNVYLGTKLISMYAKTGSLVDARLVFDHMPERSVFSWNNLDNFPVVCLMIGERVTFFKCPARNPNNTWQTQSLQGTGICDIKG
jgi:pentatricopeptide repeat protein